MLNNNKSTPFNTVPVFLFFQYVKTRFLNLKNYYPFNSTKNCPLFKLAHTNYLKSS